MTKKQKIFLATGGGLFGLALFSSFSIELARATKQQRSDSVAVLLNTFIGGIERVASPLGITCLVVLVAVFSCYKKPRDGGTEEDGYELLSQATHLEAEGRILEATAAYEKIATKYSHTTAGTDAQRSLESLQRKLE